MFDIDWSVAFSHLVHLVAAYLLALPIAWDREQHARSAGLRTFPLVALGACGYMLTGLSVLEDSPEAHGHLMYGIIVGMGFIGGGAILKGRQRVSGTATAAGLWNTGAIGVAIAWDRFEIALVISALGFLTFRLFAHLKREDEDEAEAPD